MKFHLLGLVLLGSLLLVANAEPEPKPVQVIGRRSSFFNEPASAKFRSANADKDVQLIAAEVDDDEDTDGNDDKAASGNGNKDASSGRLFMKKFLLFKNMFSSGNQQPVIPIIITGAGTGTGTTNPTTTITSTGTIPTATGTVTTTPTTAGTGTATSRTNDEDEPVQYGAADEQTLQAALAAGAQEYIVTGEPIQGTGNQADENDEEEAAAGAGSDSTDMSKASRQPARINLRRKGSRRGQGQVISVRIPPRYRRYFKNGQKVMLNTNNRPGKRRVIRKRVQTNRRKGNKKNKGKGKGKGGKRTRITAA